MKKIKIVFGVNDFLVGGMQRQLAEQVRHFDMDQFDITLITLFQFPDKATFYDELPNGLKVHRLNFSGSHDIKEWRRLYGLLRDIKPDIVVSSLFFSNTIFRVLKPFVGYISIAREHNTYIFKIKLHQFIDRVLSYLSYRIVAVSNTVADFTAQQEGIRRGKFVVIHNGIDVELIQNKLKLLPSKEDIKNELGLVGKKIVVNVARLTSQKNHKMLIDGFLLFQKRFPDYVLIITGDGSLRNDLEEYVASFNAENIILFYGSRRDVWRFYKVADFFASASSIEGLSNSYLEALASGIPIVSTKTAGTDELIEDGENGFLVGDHSPVDVSEGLSKASSVSLVVFGKKALETVKKFDIHTTVRAYSDLFREAMKR